MPMPEIANRFELRCQSKQLMLLYYKINLCYEIHFREQIAKSFVCQQEQSDVQDM